MQGSRTREDRPYAGWLYTGLMLQRSGIDRYGYLTSENFQVDIGVIGPVVAGENRSGYISSRAACRLALSTGE